MTATQDLVGAKLMMRIGDAGEYHDFEDVGLAAFDLAAALDNGGHRQVEIDRHDSNMLTGVNVPAAGLIGENAVSLYWEDRHGETVELADEDFDAFCESVNLELEHTFNQS